MKRGELNDPHRIKSYCLMSIEKIDRLSQDVINRFKGKGKLE